VKRIRPTWPGGASFAFTVFDDTDMTTLVNGPPVYDVLTDLGLSITKSVWPVAPAGKPRTGGTTCADPAYVDWVLGLQEAGHEIGYHNASDHTSTREQTIAGIDRFAELFGHDPRIGADHSANVEAVYGGPRRLTGPRGWLYERGSKITHPNRKHGVGHEPESEYFWGDVLHERIDYWRNFTFFDINTLGPCPMLPFHDPVRPYVKWWFASSHAPHLEPFLDLVSPENLDRLEEEGGVCIVYTHFGVNFAPDGKLDPRFAPALERIASRNGWFAPASEVLDHLRTANGAGQDIDRRARSRMENRWVRDQLRGRGGAEARRALARVRRTEKTPV